MEGSVFPRGVLLLLSLLGVGSLLWDFVGFLRLVFCNLVFGFRFALMISDCLGFELPWRFCL